MRSNKENAIPSSKNILGIHGNTKIDNQNTNKAMNEYQKDKNGPENTQVTTKNTDNS